MKKHMIVIIVTGAILAASALAQRHVFSSNIVGDLRENPPVTVSGEVAFAWSPSYAGVPVAQIAGTGISVVIDGLVVGHTEGPAKVSHSAVWMLVVTGRLVDVIVEHAPLVLASQIVSNGVLRTRDFGNVSIYLHDASKPAALVVPDEELPRLRKWLTAQKRGTHADPSTGGDRKPAPQP